MTIHEIDQLAGYIGIVAIFLLAQAFILLQFRANYNLSNIPKNIKNVIDTLIFGKKVIIKINGIWMLGRGWRNKKSEILHATYGPDWRQCLLLERDWWKTYSDWSEEYLQNIIVKLNIKELKIKHPRKEDYRKAPHFSFPQDEINENNLNPAEQMQQCINEM